VTGRPLTPNHLGCTRIMYARFEKFDPPSLALQLECLSWMPLVMNCVLIRRTRICAIGILGGSTCFRTKKVDLLEKDWGYLSIIVERSTIPYKRPVSSPASLERYGWVDDSLQPRLTAIPKLSPTSLASSGVLYSHYDTCQGLEVSC
jgi:hypothetical protein